MFNSFSFFTSLRGKIPCLKIVLDVQTKKAANCSGYDTNILYLLAGSGNSITCPGIKCYSHTKKPDVKWYKVRVSLAEWRQSFRSSKCPCAIVLELFFGRQCQRNSIQK